MRKALFLPVGIGLAHVGRMAVLAKELQKKGIRVVFGAGGDAIPILKRENLPFKTLLEFDRKVYDEKVKKNNPFVYTRRLVEEFVNDELRLYRKEKPDVIVYDTRLTAKISAVIAGIPTVSITNVDATPFYDFSQVKFPSQTVFARFLPVKTLSLLQQKYSQRLLSRIGPNVLKAILLGEIIRLSPALFKLGFRLSFDPYQFFLGDLTLLADIEEYRPIKKLPGGVKIVGPIFWDGSEELPDWQKSIEGRSDIIYVTAAGTGDKIIFLKTLEYLKDSDFTIVASTGNTLKLSEVNVSYPKLFVADFLPGSWIMSKAKLVIFPGGNATAYQALYHGVPQICTPFHFDQEDNANQLERLQTGIIVNPYHNFTKRVLLKAVRKILYSRKYYKNAQKIREILKRCDGKKRAVEEIIKFLKD